MILWLCVCSGSNAIGIGVHCFIVFDVIRLVSMYNFVANLWTSAYTFVWTQASLSRTRWGFLRFLEVTEVVPWKPKLHRGSSTDSFFCRKQVARFCAPDIFIPTKYHASSKGALNLQGISIGWWWMYFQHESGCQSCSFRRTAAISSHRASGESIRHLMVKSVLRKPL